MKNFTYYLTLTICAFALIACFVGIIGNLTYKPVSSTRVSIDTVEDITVGELVLNIEGEKIVSADHSSLYLYDMVNIKSFELIKEKNIFGFTKYSIGETYKN